MALQDASAVAPAFSPFHMEPAELDGLLDAHGAPAEIRTAMRCGCWAASSGQPDPGCDRCYPFGYVWDAPVTCRVYGPSRRGLRRYELAGTLDVGDAWFSLPTGMRPPHYSRIVLTASEITVDDTLTRGREDVIRFSRPVAVTRAHWSQRTSAPGVTPVTRTNVPLVLGTDLSVSGRRVTWIAETPPPGTRYVLQLRALAEYIVWEPQDRNEAGVALNYKFLCKRLDFLRHPAEGVEGMDTY